MAKVKARKPSSVKRRWLLDVCTNCDRPLDSGWSRCHCTPMDFEDGNRTYVVYEVEEVRILDPHREGVYE